MGIEVSKTISECSSVNSCTEKSNRIKMALFDYDGTVCVWSSPIYGTGHNSDANILAKGVKAYDGCFAPKVMVDFVNHIHSMGVDVHLLSCTNEVKIPVKHEWCVEKYGEPFKSDAYRSEETPEAKADKALEVCAFYGVKPEETLFVDDNHFMLYGLYNAGFIIITPQEILSNPMVFDINNYPWRTKKDGEV